MTDALQHEPPRRATDHDLMMALVVLGSLPRRRDQHAELDTKVFLLALEGKRPGHIEVTACDLAAAARLIVQGGLGHGFHPSPAELRLMCRAAQDQRAEEQARYIREARQERERQALFGSMRPEPSEEEKARVRARYEQFVRECGEAEAGRQGRTTEAGGGSKV